MTRERTALGDALAESLAVPELDFELARARALARERLFGESPPTIRIGRFIMLERIGQGAMGMVFGAYDPELDRKIAIKLLVQREDEVSERTRLAAEARAMAKLSHPNVVHVYEVGEYQGRLFIAMELVRGVTLRQWLTSPHSAALRLEVCMQAGRGLAAAHAAGLTHRDFKPENVIVGDDGITRVLDFGLAKPADLVAVDPTHAASSDHALAISTASVHGTPGYVAAEVLRGAPASARSDKFSLAVTIWEALTGQLPFDGPTGDARLASTLSGRIADGVPRPPAWIERLLRRELEGAGLGSVDELLAALARDPGPIRRRRGIMLGAAIVIAGAYVAGGAWRPDATRAEVVIPCSGAAEIFDRTWTTDARARAIDRLAGLGDYGALAAPRIATAVERFATEWIEGHHDACMARERGELEDDMLGRRMTCLDRHRSALAALREVIDTAEQRELPALVLAAEGLPRPSDCGELDRLEQQSPPVPLDAQPLADEVARAQVAYRAGRTLALRPQIAQLVATAREVDHPPLLAELLYLDGLLHIDAADRAGAMVPLGEATKVAFAAGQERLALQAWSNRLWAEATSGHRPSRESFEIVEALAERHGDDPQILGVFTNLGSIELSSGRRAEARRVLERGAELGRRMGERGRRTLALVESNLAISIDDLAERRSAYEHAIASWTELAGAEHPRTLGARVGRAASSDDDRWSLGELQEITATLLRLHPDVTRTIVLAETELLLVADLLGDEDVAREAARQLAERSERFGAIYGALWSGQLDRAEALAAVAVEDEPVDASSLWYSRRNRGSYELALGRAWAAANDPRARDMLASALGHLEAAAPYDQPGSARRYLAIARRELARHEP